MKQTKYLSTAVLIIFALLFSTVPTHAQDPPPPPPPDHGGSGNVPGGGAPVGDGLLILLTAAGFYLFRKSRQSAIQLKPGIKA